MFLENGLFENEEDNSHYFDDSSLGMLSVVRICCMKGHFIFKNHLMNTKTMGSTALSIYKHGGPLQKIIALKICKLVLPSLDENDVGDVTNIVAEESSSSIIRYFINEIGRLVGYSDKKVIKLNIIQYQDSS